MPSPLQQVLDYCRTDPAKSIAYIIVVCCFIYICILFLKNGSSAYRDLIGKDGLQIIEAIGIVWLIIFTVLVIIDPLGLKASDQVWWTMNSIFVVLVGGKAALKHIGRNEKKGDVKEG